MTALPLVPEKCTSNGLPAMMIEINTLSNSKMWLRLPHTAVYACMNLMMKSWHFIPCGSLPNDDALLNHYAGIGRKWNGVKNVVLDEFILASDNRYYHPYVARKGLEIWIQSLIYSIEGNKGNEKRWGITIDNSELISDLKDALNHLKKLSPSSKTLENNILKAIKKSEKLLNESKSLSDGDRNIKLSKEKRMKENVKTPSNVNDLWKSSNQVQPKGGVI